MTPEPYIIKPLGITQDKRITSVEQDYVCLIAQLSRREDGCTASNNFFARYFGVQRQTAVEVISTLRRKKIIVTTEKKKGGKTIQRTINIIDANSRDCLLMDSRKYPMGLVGNADVDSRKYPNLKLKGKEREKNSFTFNPGENTAGQPPEPDEAAILKALGYPAESEAV